MNCPVCRAVENQNAALRVRRTTLSAAANAVTRRRVCPRCKASVTTVEQIISTRPAGVKAAALVVSTADGRR